MRDWGKWYKNSFDTVAPCSILIIACNLSVLWDVFNPFGKKNYLVLAGNILDPASIYALELRSHSWIRLLSKIVYIKINLIEI